MKYILFIILQCVFILVHSQQFVNKNFSTSDLDNRLPYNVNGISWCKLSWSDFKGSATLTGIAMTCTAVYISTHVKEGKYYFKVYSIFIPEESFTKTSSEKVLQHEQLHFDISELCARKIIKAIEPHQGCEKKQVNYVYEVYKRGLMDLEILQRRYETDTQHSLNEANQQQWLYTIRSQWIN